jgi:DNA-binding response OmpR family regulator
MDKPPGTRTEITGEIVPVICISPLDEDHFSLKRIVSSSKSDGGPNWVFHAVSTLKSALPLLRTSDVPIVLCERDLGSTTWKEVLQELIMLPSPPLLIVSSRTADEHLWAEALNLGAYDVLAKPFDGDEVNRVLGFAWFHKKNELQQRSRMRTMNMAAAG